MALLQRLRGPLSRSLRAAGQASVFAAAYHEKVGLILDGSQSPGILIYLRDTSN